MNRQTEKADFTERRILHARERLAALPDEIVRAERRLIQILKSGELDAEHGAHDNLERREREILRCERELALLEANEAE